ncbi:MAG: NAD(+) synthase [Oscillospiraceae bacterium]|nr:NAD(+) synthase [Oscillospiraceae bacterium]
MKFNNFIKVAAATPQIKIADCEHNAKQIINIINNAAEQKAALVVFPELCITGYTCGDLFLQKTLQDAAAAALKQIVNATADKNVVCVIGLPVNAGGRLYNCAAVVLKGRVLGLVCKQKIPNYTEFYEARYFASGTQAINAAAKAQLQATYMTDCFGENLLFVCNQNPDFTFGVEICEDLWQPGSPSQLYATAGGRIICNLSASPELVGKPDYRRDLVRVQSGKLCCGYILANAGAGESSSDLVYSGHNIIAENGVLLNQSEPFNTGVIYSDIDLQRLTHDRVRMNTFAQNSSDVFEQPVTAVNFDFEFEDFKLNRTISKTPFVPNNMQSREKVCNEILNLQSSGLATRLSAIGCKTAVIGVSGGLDSTLALIVTARAFDMLKLPKSGILAVSMPCFGTTQRTKTNAENLAQAFGAKYYEIDITAAVKRHFEDIGQNPNSFDVTYENCQARERTQVLMDMANMHSGIVIGTGDLSESALGFATYNGDHMSMYAVNCSVPKTLVRYLVEFAALQGEQQLRVVLTDVLNTPVSPELLPPQADGTIAQRTEEIIGPYELHDFFLYYFVRFGYAPPAILELAQYAFGDDYTKAQIKNYLKLFLKRFFANQFKRNAMPDGPKVGTVSLSQRGDWRMPSDASVAEWLSKIE